MGDGGYESLRHPIYSGIQDRVYESLPRSLSSNSPKVTKGITGLHGFSSRSSSLRRKDSQRSCSTKDAHLLYAQVDRSKKRRADVENDSSPDSNQVPPSLLDDLSRAKEPLYATIGHRPRPILLQSSSVKTADV